MIFISGVISTIFQTNMLCTNKTRVIYFYLNCVNFFARKRSFLLFFSGQLPPCHHPPNSWAYVHSPLYERKLKKNINIVFFSKIFSPSAWAYFWCGFVEMLEGIINTESHHESPRVILGITSLTIAIFYVPFSTGNSIS